MEVHGFNLCTEYRRIEHYKEIKLVNTCKYVDLSVEVHFILFIFGKESKIGPSFNRRTL